MSEMKHTQGPWIVSRNHPMQIVVEGRRGFHDNFYRVADAYFSSAGLSNTPYADEAKANARLIAAAPDLLEAAKFTWAAMGSEEGRKRAKDALFAAIAKATPAARDGRKEGV